MIVAPSAVSLDTKINGHFLYVLVLVFSDEACLIFLICFRTMDHSLQTCLNILFPKQQSRSKDINIAKALNDLLIFHALCEDTTKFKRETFTKKVSYTRGTRIVLYYEVISKMRKPLFKRSKPATVLADIYLTCGTIKQKCCHFHCPSFLED